MFEEPALAYCDLIVKYYRRLGRQGALKEGVR